MASFLFWNLCGRRLELVLRRLIRRHEIDVLMLAECAIPEDSMLDFAQRGVGVARSGAFRRLRHEDQTSILAL